MNLRSLVSAALCLVPLSLSAGNSEFAKWLDAPIAESPVHSHASPSSVAGEESESQEWIEFDFSAEELDAEYERTIGVSEEKVDEVIAEWMTRIRGGGKVVIPIVFQAQVQPGEAEAAAEKEDKNEEPVVEDPEEMRIEQLEMENAALKARLAQAEPFVDPDWPAADMRPKRSWRARLRRRPVQIAPQVPRRPVATNYRQSVRFKPFTRAALDTPAYGRISRARGQSYEGQLRFFQNATKAIGAGVASREYRGVRLEVESAMLSGEVTARYAVQYLADVVDIFRTYERLERFGLTDGVAPPMSADSFRRDPNRMFRWASEVREQKRKLNLEDSLAR